MFVSCNVQIICFMMCRLLLTTAKSNFLKTLLAAKTWTTATTLASISRVSMVVLACLPLTSTVAHAQSVSRTPTAKTVRCSKYLFCLRINARLCTRTFLQNFNHVLLNRLIFKINVCSCVRVRTRACVYVLTCLRAWVHTYVSICLFACAYGCGYKMLVKLKKHCKISK